MIFHNVLYIWKDTELCLLILIPQLYIFSFNSLKRSYLPIGLSSGFGIFKAIGLLTFEDISPILLG